MCALAGCVRPTDALGLCHRDYVRRWRKAAGSEDPWLLPSDGIHDSVAVSAAAAGARQVRLCPTERLLAACMILAQGGTADDVSERLAIGKPAALALVRRIDNGHREGRYPEHSVMLDYI